MTHSNPYIISTQAIAKNFNRAAKTYDQFSELPQQIAKSVIERLNIMKIQPQRMLDIGSGTGFTARLLEKAFPAAYITQIDIAENMLQIAKHQSKETSKQHFICANTLQLPLANQSIDIIMANLMLYWTFDLDVVFNEWQRVLRPNGLLMFTTYGPDTLTELRRSWAQVDEAIHVNAFIDMHDIGDALMHARFADPVMDTEYFTLNYPSVRSLFDELKNLGESNLNQGRRHQLTGKNKFDQMINVYEKTFQNAQQKIPATYEVIYGHAWKPEISMNKKQNENGEFIIPLSELYFARA